MRKFVVLVVTKLEDTGSRGGNHLTEYGSSRSRQKGRGDVEVVDEGLASAITEETHGRMRVICCQTEHAIHAGLEGGGLLTSIVSHSLVSTKEPTRKFDSSRRKLGLR